MVLADLLQHLHPGPAFLQGMVGRAGSDQPAVRQCFDGDDEAVHLARDGPEPGAQLFELAQLLLVAEHVTGRHEHLAARDAADLYRRVGDPVAFVKGN